MVLTVPVSRRFTSLLTIGAFAAAGFGAAPSVSAQGGMFDLAALRAEAERLLGSDLEDVAELGAGSSGPLFPGMSVLGDSIFSVPVAGGAIPRPVHTEIRHDVVITLAPGWEIAETLVGDPTRWRVTTYRSLIIVQPGERGAQTNLTVILMSGDVFQIDLLEVTPYVGVARTGRVYIGPEPWLVDQVFAFLPAEAREVILGTGVSIPRLLEDPLSVVYTLLYGRPSGLGRPLGARRSVEVAESSVPVERPAAPRSVARPAVEPVPRTPTDPREEPVGERPDEDPEAGPPVPEDLILGVPRQPPPDAGPVPPVVLGPAVPAADVPATRVPSVESPSPPSPVSPDVPAGRSGAPASPPSSVPDPIRRESPDASVPDLPAPFFDDLDVQFPDLPGVPDELVPVRRPGPGPAVRPPSREGRPGPQGPSGPPVPDAPAAGSSGAPGVPEVSPPVGRPGPGPAVLPPSRELDPRLQGPSGPPVPDGPADSGVPEPRTGGGAGGSVSRSFPGGDSALQEYSERYSVFDGSRQGQLQASLVHRVVGPAVPDAVAGRDRFPGGTLPVAGPPGPVSAEPAGFASAEPEAAMPAFSASGGVAPAASVSSVVGASDGVAGRSSGVEDAVLQPSAAAGLVPRVVQSAVQRSGSVSGGPVSGGSSDVGESIFPPSAEDRTPSLEQERSPVFVSAERLAALRAARDGLRRRIADEQAESGRNASRGVMDIEQDMEFLRMSYPEQIYLSLYWDPDLHPLEPPFWVYGLWHDTDNTFVRLMAPNPVFRDEERDVEVPAEALDSYLYRLSGVIDRGSVTVPDGGRAIRAYWTRRPEVERP